MSLLTLLRRHTPPTPIYLRADTPRVQADHRAFHRITQELARRPIIPATRTQSRRP
jgi:hypothetical protein